MYGKIWTRRGRATSQILKSDAQRLLLDIYVKTCKGNNQAWEILETEFANERKLMDELLPEMNNLKHVKRDSMSLTRYAMTISVFVNDMEDSGCTVLEVSEALFFMSQLLSKLDPRDNTNFGRAMQRAGKEENV